MINRKRAIRAVVAACVVLVCAGVVRFVYMRPVSPEEYEKARNAPQTLAFKDVAYESPSGFSMLIPAGFNYSIIESRHFTVFASNPPIHVEGTKYRWRFGSLDKLFTAGAEQLQRQNNTVRFRAPVNLDMGSGQGIRADYTMIFTGGTLRGTLLWFRIGHTLYQFVFTVPDHEYHLVSEDYERMVNSFTIR